MMPIVQHVLEAKANPNVRDRWDNTPLAEAVSNGHMSIARHIEECGGRLGWDEVRAVSELCELARKGEHNQIEVLLAVGCPVNCVDYDRRSALHLAASEGAVRVVETLMDAGADLNKFDRWNGTPMRDAIRNGHERVALLLLERGAVLGLSEADAAGELCEQALCVLSLASASQSLASALLEPCICVH